MKWPKDKSSNKKRKLPLEKQNRSKNNEEKELFKILRTQQKLTNPTKDLNKFNMKSSYNSKLKLSNIAKINVTYYYNLEIIQDLTKQQRQNLIN